MEDWKTNLGTGICIVLIVAVVGSCTYLDSIDSRTYNLELKKLELEMLKLNSNKE